MLVGALDEASRRRIRGWVRQPAFPDAPVLLVITAGDQLLDRVVANKHRPDLEKVGLGNGRFGLDFEFNPPLAPDRPWTIHVRSEIEGYEMPGSPFRIEPSTAFDEAAQEAFAASIAAFSTPQELDARIRFLVAQRDRLFQMRAASRSSEAEREAVRAGRVKATRLRRRALFIDERIPEPDIDAGSSAVLSHMRSAQRLGYEVSFACPAMTGGPRAEALEQQGIACCNAPWFASIEELLHKETGLYDVVYLHRVTTAAAYALLVRQHQPRARLVYSVADLYHVRLARQADAQGRPELMVEARQLRTQEFWAAAMADAVITHTPEEARLLKHFLPDANLHTVAWSVAAIPRGTAFPQRNGLAFIGNYNHAPNLDAARLLRDEIMPAVQAVDPGIRCGLVGVGLPASLQAATPGTHYLGHVPRLDDLFDRIRLTVAPLAFGAGLKGKVLESLAAGIPCVCFPIAAEGLGLPEALAPLVVQDTAGMVSAIIRLHKIASQNARMARASLAYVADRYTEQRLDDAMQAVLGRAEIPPPAIAAPAKAPRLPATPRISRVRTR